MVEFAINLKNANNKHSNKFVMCRLHTGKTTFRTFCQMTTRIRSLFYRTVPAKEKQTNV